MKGLMYGGPELVFLVAGAALAVAVSPWARRRYVTWGALRPDGAGTRLISRNRITPPGGNPAVRALYDVVMAPGSLIMERRMLQGIRQRAEGLSALPDPVTGS
ncbi:hypothetical protein Aab01nite_54610 [Paractinoplanes abujensis]|uniref:Uncharacterized protein n=1 Tax=Paractinoplanes abujensis TaxID=882441 RepID=A0A7W7CUZ2_9ACTN|nr:hypothetical protein [Actinoplanes abujensis]MBB4693471.1 hypothetical protein [Actinoplanes abujensis]GID21871.1 hypothetical protein Aab01nite_54610 [Actinoplanes abujensis]